MLWARLLSFAVALAVCIGVDSASVAKARRKGGLNPEVSTNTSNLRMHAQENFNETSVFHTGAVSVNNSTGNNATEAVKYSNYHVTFTEATEAPGDLTTSVAISTSSGTANPVPAASAPHNGSAGAKAASANTASPTSGNTALRMTSSVSSAEDSSTAGRTVEPSPASNQLQAGSVAPPVTSTAGNSVDTLPALSAVAGPNKSPSTNATDLDRQVPVPTVQLNSTGNSGLLDHHTGASAVTSSFPSATASHATSATVQSAPAPTSSVAGELGMASRAPASTAAAVSSSRVTTVTAASASKSGHSNTDVPSSASKAPALPATEPPLSGGVPATRKVTQASSLHTTSTPVSAVVPTTPVSSVQTPPEAEDAETSSTVVSPTSSSSSSLGFATSAPSTAPSTTIHDTERQTSSAITIATAPATAVPPSTSPPRAKPYFSTVITTAPSMETTPPPPGRTTPGGSTSTSASHSTSPHQTVAPTEVPAAELPDSGSTRTPVHLATTHALAQSTQQPPTASRTSADKAVTTSSMLSTAPFQPTVRTSNAPTTDPGTFLPPGFLHLPMRTPPPKLVVTSKVTETRLPSTLGATTAPPPTSIVSPVKTSTLPAHAASRTPPTQRLESLPHRIQAATAAVKTSPSHSTVHSATGTSHSDRPTPAGSVGISPSKPTAATARTSRRPAPSSRTMPTAVSRNISMTVSTAGLNHTDLFAEPPTYSTAQLAITYVYCGMAVIVAMASIAVYLWSQRPRRNRAVSQALLQSNHGADLDDANEDDDEEEVEVYSRRPLKSYPGWLSTAARKKGAGGAKLSYSPLDAEEA